MIITNIILTDDSMIINIERVGWKSPGSYRGGPLLEYKNIPTIMTFNTEVKEEWQSRYRSTMQIIVDLKDIPRVIFNEEDELFDEDGYYKRILYLYEEAEITILFIVSCLEAIIFIEEDKVRIMSQKYLKTHIFS